MSQSALFEKWLYDKKIRHVLYQVVCLSAVLGLGYFFLHAASVKLEKQGIASGFAFLDHRSGFSIAQSLIPYSEDSTYLRAFFVGLINTILMSALGIVCATILGFVIGISRLSSNYLLSRLATAYIEILRNVPLLLQLFFWYFVVLRSLPGVRDSFVWGESVFLNNRGIYTPSLMGEPGSLMVIILSLLAIPALFIYSSFVSRRQMGTGVRWPVWPAYLIAMAWVALVTLSAGMPFTVQYPELGAFNITGGLALLPELVALWVSLSLYTASFIAEIVRAGITAVPRGQVEAARSLGLSYGVTLRKVVIPQAMRVIIPPLTSQYLNLTKNTSLGATIGYPELVSVFAGTVLNQTGQAVEVLAITMGVYLSLSLTLSVMMNVYNKRKMLKER